MSTAFVERLARGEVLVADGATGTNLQAMGLPAGAMPEERARCLAAGMQDFLTKPLLPAELKRVLDTWAPLGRDAVPEPSDPLPAVYVANQQH